MKRQLSLGLFLHLIALVTSTVVVVAALASTDVAASRVSSIDFEVVHLEKSAKDDPFPRLHIYVLVSEQDFNEDAILELFQFLAMKYQDPNDLLAWVYTNRKQLPRDLFAKVRSSGTSNPHHYVYPGALMMRSQERITVRMRMRPDTYRLHSFYFDQHWAPLAPDPH